MFFSPLYDSFHIFAVGHGPAVVFNENFRLQPFFKNLSEGFLFEIENAVTIARCWVHAAGDIDSNR